jgi:hypothetical protein
MQVMQFIYLTYFGIQLSSSMLYFMQKGIGDVGTEIAFLWKDYFYVLPMVFILFALIYFFNKKFATKKPWIGILMIACIFGSIEERLCTGIPPCFTPNWQHIIIYNFLKAILVILSTSTKTATTKIIDLIPSKKSAF